MKTENLWDIFCRVIDNFGDIGVCWRLAAGLAARGQQVRLWVDDASALSWMAPEGAPGVEVRPWSKPLRTEGLTVGRVLVEAFGCDIDPEFIALYKEQTGASGQKPVWINLEYLSAEDFAKRCHRLPSPVMCGPGAGLTKHFFYPGFTPQTGGLLREFDLAERQKRFDRKAWLRKLDLDVQDERLVSLFCYEPAALGELMERLAADGQTTRLLVTAGRSSAAVKACIKDKSRANPLWNKRETLSICYLPTLTQCDFDHLLWCCDLNFVRGEDSLVRALWAGKPFVWQIYPQQDAAHHGKLDAFLDMLDAPPTLRATHHLWNGIGPGPLPALSLGPWQQCMTETRTRLLAQDDLVTQIMGFAQ